LLLYIFSNDTVLVIEITPQVREDEESQNSYC
jgi:hypothetical protein